MHSATKYLNGHSDVMAGALTTAREDAFWQRLRSARSSAGAILGSFEAYLLLRGMRTLFPRVERACRSAQQIAEALSPNPKVLEVLYPGLATNPGHAVAERQMNGGFGGMLSIRVRGGAEAAIAAAAARRSLEARHLAWRRRMPDRAPRLGRRPQSGSARSAPSLGRHRGPGRSDRGFGDRAVRVMYRVTKSTYRKNRMTRISLVLCRRCAAGWATARRTGEHDRFHRRDRCSEQIARSGQGAR